MGIFAFLLLIELPSVIGYYSGINGKAYYSLPWERGADFFGGVNRSTGYYGPSDVLSALHFRPLIL